MKSAILLSISLKKNNNNVKLAKNCYIQMELAKNNITAKLLYEGNNQKIVKLGSFCQTSCFCMWQNVQTMLVGKCEYLF